MRALLQQPAYTGTLEFGRQEWRQDAGGKSRPVGPRAGGGIRIPCPALISPETWVQAQARLQLEMRLPGRPSATYLLRGCIRCAGCRLPDGHGRLLCGARENSNPTRPGYHRYRYRCPGCSRSLHGPRLEVRARVMLEEALSEARVRRRLEQREAQRRARAGGAGERLGKIRRELAQCDQDEERVADLIEAGLSPNVVRGRVAKIRERRSAALAALQAVEAEAGEAASPQLRQSLTEAAALLALIRSGDAAALQRAFQRYIRITAYTGGRSVVEFVAE